MADEQPNEPEEGQGDYLRIFSAAVLAALALAATDLATNAFVDPLPIWGPASVPLAAFWSFGLWTVVAGLPAVALAALEVATRSSRMLPRLQRILAVVFGAGESRAAGVVLFGALLGLPRLIEPLLWDMSWAAQLPGMAKSIVAAGLTTALALVVHRIVAWRRPRFAATPTLALVAFLAASYTWLEDVATLAPFSLLPLAILFPTALVAAFAAADTSRRSFRLPILAVGGLAAIGTLATASADSATHAALMKGTRLYFPATQLVWLATDFDGDRESAVLGGSDCEGFDGEVYSQAREVVSSERDENCGSGPPPPPAVAPKGGDGPRRNIILVTVDALRADHVGMKIDGRSLTPSLDELVSEAHSFEFAYTASTHTNGAIPSLLSGRYPSTWGEDLGGFLPGASLPIALRANGYLTVALPGIPGMGAPISNGFEFVENSIADFNRSWTDVTAFRSVKAAVEVLQAHDRSRPLFLWVHFMDPHAYYVADGELEGWLGGGALAANYRHEVHRTDRALGELFAALRDLGYFDDSIVAFTADHGEAFGEHGTFTHVWDGYEEVVRVPLIVRRPDATGQRHTATVSLVDLAPTLLDEVGIAASGFDGSSLRGLFDGEDVESRPAFVETFYDDRLIVKAAIDGRTKYMIDPQRNVHELYDLQSDPQEATNLVESAPELREKMSQLMDGWWDAVHRVP